MNIKIQGSMNIISPDLTVTDCIGKVTYSELDTPSGSKVVNAESKFWKTLTDYENSEDILIFETPVQSFFVFELSAEELGQNTVEYLVYQRVSNLLNDLLVNIVIVENI